MVKRVSLFQTADGQTFETEAAAKEHEAKIAAKTTITALLKKLNWMAHSSVSVKKIRWRWIRSCSTTARRCYWP